MSPQGSIGAPAVPALSRSERFVALPVVRAGFKAVFAESRQVFDRHTHDVFAFGLIDRGGQRWNSGRGQVEARAGDVIMSNPGEVHDGSPMGDESRTWTLRKYWNVPERQIQTAVVLSL